METLINILNNREKALLIWLLLVLVCILVIKSFRTPLLLALKALFISKVGIGLAAMVVYISLVVLMPSRKLCNEMLHRHIGETRRD